MRIGILGSRGIPNSYGGFEACAEKLSRIWVQNGHEVSVYCSHLHPYKDKTWDNVNRISVYDPEHRLGTFGQFVYDGLCIKDARWQKFDILLQLGYTSSGIWQAFLPKKSRVITNMDGLEWKRSKYNWAVKRFLKLSEAWAAKAAHQLVADSKAIQSYLDHTYGPGSVFIPYGADIPDNPNPELLSKYSVEPGKYQLILARMEPENHIETILDGILLSQYNETTLVVGASNNRYSDFLKNKYRDARIRFINAVYDQNETDALRTYCKRYFHGHSVGGTNPSLLEAMASGCLIYAHNNPFNQEVLGSSARYFNNANQIAEALNHPVDARQTALWKKQNLETIRLHYNWNIIAEQYEVLFNYLLNN